MIGVICPSRFEYRYLSSLYLNPKKAVLACTGMGKLRALQGCHRLVQRYPKVKHLFLIGYAGGLSGLKVGDLIEPAEFIEYDYDARPFEKYPHTIRTKAKKIFAHSHRSAILTQDRFLTSNPFKGTEAAGRHAKLACDMESYAVAYFAKTHGVGLTVLKFISDEADSNAEHDFLKACKNLSGQMIEAVREAVARKL